METLPLESMERIHVFTMQYLLFYSWSFKLGKWILLPDEYRFLYCRQKILEMKGNIRRNEYLCVLYSNISKLISSETFNKNTLHPRRFSKRLRVMSCDMKGFLKCTYMLNLFIEYIQGILTIPIETCKPEHSNRVM